MLIGSIGPSLLSAERRDDAANPSDKGFAQMLEDALTRVNDLQLERDRLSVGLATGEVQNLHDVTIATARAQIALETVVAVQNKVIEAYHEISRMQV